MLMAAQAEAQAFVVLHLKFQVMLFLRKLLNQSSQSKHNEIMLFAQAVKRLKLSLPFLF